MNRPSRMVAACVGLLALITAGFAAPQSAEAHFFHRWGYGGWGYGWGGPRFHPRPWFLPRVYYVPPPPPVYVAPRVAFMPPPVYGYAWRYRYGYRVHHYYRHVYYRHVVHAAAVHHTWCRCGCCR